MSNEGEDITIHCKKCNKSFTIINPGSFHTYVKCPDCGGSIIKHAEKSRLKKLASRNAEIDTYLTKEIVGISEPFLRRKTERELWKYHGLLTSYLNIEGAKEQAELIMNILNEWDREKQIREEEEITQHIINHDNSLFGRYDVKRLLKYKETLEKHRELDKNNKLKLIIELIIEKDKTGKYAKACKIELVKEIVNMPMYQLIKLKIIELKKYKKYLDKSKVDGAKEQSREIEDMIKRKMEE